MDVWRWPRERISARQAVYYIELYLRSLGLSISDLNLTCKSWSIASTRYTTSDCLPTIRTICWSLDSFRELALHSFPVLAAFNFIVCGRLVFLLALPGNTGIRVVMLSLAARHIGRSDVKTSRRGSCLHCVLFNYTPTDHMSIQLLSYWISYRLQSTLQWLYCFPCI